jgi:hypothetical protein
MTLLLYKKMTFQIENGYSGIYCHLAAKAETVNWARAAVRS